MPLIRGHHAFDDHYTQIPNSWVRDTRLSLRGKGLLAQLMSHRPGWNVSLKSLAVANNCGVDNIRGAVNELIEAGYLERSETRDRNDQGHLTDYTYVTKDPSDSPTLGKPTLVNPMTKNNILKEQQEPKELPHAEREGELGNAAQSQAFDEFWAIYPRKVDKLAARRAFDKAWGSYGVAVMDGVRRLAADPNLPPKQFVPYPASWLNAGGWESEPYPERERTAEEKLALAKAEVDRRRLLDLEASRRLAEESKAAREAAEANPVTRCEHDRVKVMCLKCSPILKSVSGHKPV